MKTEQQYTDELIEKYSNIENMGLFSDNGFSTWSTLVLEKQAIQCAKIDVQNTIDAVLDIALQSKQHRLYKYYTKVLTILNDMK